MKEKMENTKKFFSEVMNRKSADYPGTIGLKLDALAWYQFALYGRDDETYDADKWARIIMSIVRKVKKSDSDYASASTIDAALTVIQRAQDARFARKAYDKVKKAIALTATDRPEEIPSSVMRVLYTLTCETEQRPVDAEVLASAEVSDIMQGIYASLSERKIKAFQAIVKARGIDGSCKYILADTSRRAAFTKLIQRSGACKGASIEDIAYCFFKYL